LKGKYYELQKRFGSHLKSLREKRGLSLRDLSARCELDSSKISKMENGQTNLQLSSIFELAKGLEMNAKDILDFDI
jgi:transcriptional regulator with XRE-family HTH domain